MAAEHFQAVFVDTATTPASVLRVKIPGFDNGVGTFVVAWSPLGNALPAAGDHALVVESDDGVWWAVSWESTSQLAGLFVGQIAPSALAAAPAGWLLCDGAAVTAAHPALRTALLADGSPYGTSGSDPQLPNLNGAFPLGASGSHALGSTGGEETHKLTPAEMPAHTHDIAANTGVAGTAFPLVQAGTGSIANQTGVTQARALTTGGDGAHNNMPPFVTVKYVIYAGS